MHHLCVLPLVSLTNKIENWCFNESYVSCMSGFHFVINQSLKFCYQPLIMKEKWFLSRLNIFTAAQNSPSWRNLSGQEISISPPAIATFWHLITTVVLWLHCALQILQQQQDYLLEFVSKETGLKIQSQLHPFKDRLSFHKLLSDQWCACLEKQSNLNVQ